MIKIIIKETKNRKLLALLWQFFFFLVLIEFAECSNGSKLIINGPSDVTVKEGDNVTLSCSTSKVVNIEWLFRDYENVTVNITATQGLYEINPNNSLTIRDADSLDSGHYSCIIRNGSIIQEQSKNAMVIVTFFDILSEPTVKNIMVGAEFAASFRIRWTGDTSPKRFSWLHESIVLTNTTGEYKFRSKTKYYSGYYRGSATIYIKKLLSATDNGKYYCKMTIGAFERKFYVGTLNVTDQCNIKDYWKCPNIRKCIPIRERCDNFNDCGDLTDETTNCSHPSPPVEVTLATPDYKSCDLRYRYPKGANNFTTIFKLIHAGNVVSETEKYGDSNYDRNDFYHKKVFDNLQNGTLYTITMQSRTLRGLSRNSTVFNCTTIRMAMPGPAENLTVVVTSTYKRIWVRVRYGRPIDDGGTLYLKGFFTSCLAGVANKLNNCTKIRTVLGSSKSGYEPLYNLKAERKYYFSVYFTNVAKQDGPAISIFYTTPKETGYTSMNSSSSSYLSTGAIVGIAIAACILVMIIAGIGQYLKDRSNRSEAPVSYLQCKSG